MIELKKTPLNEVHHQLGAKFVDFAGWEMPIQYESIITEHHNTRNAVSLFDVSHMGEIFIEGTDALSNLQRLTCNDVSRLSDGEVQYSALLYENGTFVDDVTVYRISNELYFLCVNASNTDKDFQWIRSNLEGQAHCENRSAQFAQIAIQGKYAQQVLESITKKTLQDLRYYCFREIDLDGHPVILARMGYTGEDGFEIYCPPQSSEEIWETLMFHGLIFGIFPAGLGARDTLRLEVCFPLYGQDIDDRHNPLEAGLGRFVALQKKDFLGKEALQKAKSEGIQQKLIRFILDVRGIPRPHYPILDARGEQVLGEVSSGTSSPTLGKGIGMGYVPLDHSNIGETLNIQIRNRLFPATIVKPPFVAV
jgi:aminomethyltransferase